MDVQKLLNDFTNTHEQNVPSYLFPDCVPPKNSVFWNGVEYIPRPKHWASAFFSESWIIGGVEGGNCWSSGGHSPIETEEEVKEWDFELFIEEFFPDLKYKDYKKLVEKIRYHNHRSSGYYGNYTELRLKFISFDDIVEILRNSDLVNDADVSNGMDGCVSICKDAK